MSACEEEYLNNTGNNIGETIMAVDFKKEYKEFYLSKDKSEIVTVEGDFHE